MLKRIAFTLICALFVVPAHAADSQNIFKNSRAVVFGGYGKIETFRESLAALEARGSKDVVPTLIMALRYNGNKAGELLRALSMLTGETGRETWFDWMLWQQAHPEIEPHSSFAVVKADLLGRLDPRFVRFLPLRNGPSIRTEEVVWGGVAVDGIPALSEPKTIPAAEADYLIPGEEVFGVEINGDARAYPLRILNWHEMLNDTVGGVPVTLAYCTLCGAGILFETQVPGQAAPFTFGSSGLLYRSNKLMFDRQTDSLWNQFTGRPVSGELAESGIALAMHPVTITSWRDWQARHPKTTVLSLDTGWPRDYSPGAVYEDYFNSPDLMFPAVFGDNRLAAKDQVFGIRATGGAKAWPLAAFKGGRVINDRVGTVDVVLVGDSLTRTVRAWKRDGRSFAAGPDATTLTADGESWKITEDALIGPGEARLERLPGHVAYWFAWAGYMGEDAVLGAP